MQTYLKLYQDLCNQITCGKWEQGQQFPTEAEICNSFGVSRITTRQALKMLEDQGLIERYAGRGTFIKSIKPQKNAILSTDFTGSIRSGSYKVNRKLLLCKKIPAEANIAQMLDILKGTEILYAERLDIQNNEPMAYDRVFIPLVFASSISDETLTKIDFLECWLKTEKLNLNFSKESIEAIPADAYAARILNIKKHTPMLLTSEILYVNSSTPIAIFDSIYRGDKIKLISTIKK
jgi:GntR family transcriptional regulator